MTTPSMRLTDIKRLYRDHHDRNSIRDSLDEAFALGHEFGLARAVEEAAANNPFAAITQRLRQLKAERVRSVATRSEEFISEDGRVVTTVVDGAVTNITVTSEGKP